MNNCSFNQKRYQYLIEDNKEKKSFEYYSSTKNKPKISSDISSHSNITTASNFIGRDKNSSKTCVGIANSTDDKNKIYIADSLRLTASFYENDATLKINGMIQSQNSSIKKIEIMSLIFTGIGIQTINGINIIEDSDDVFNLSSSKCDGHFSTQ